MIEERTSILPQGEYTAGLVRTDEGWHIFFQTEDGTRYEQDHNLYETKEEARAYLDRLLAAANASVARMQ